MLVVKVELWPFGDESRKSTLASMVIVNTGHPEHPKRGNYSFWKLRKGQSISDRVFLSREPDGKVDNYPRLSYTVWSLVKRALKEIP